MQHRSTLGLGTVLLVALCSATACTARPASNQAVDLSSGSPFVSVRKAFNQVHAPFDSLRDAASPARERRPDGSAPPALESDVINGAQGDSDFYVAIKKSLLGERWFLSAYMKQFYPDNEAIVEDQLFADRPLGTRVVSFKLQNGRLFVFDASNNNKQSGLQDPTVLIEAYPLVEQPEFSELPGSEDYVLFDPAQGLNHFALTGAKYSNQFLAGAEPVDVGLSYMQNFHELADGAAFEQVFAGEAFFGEGQKISTWGTLGVALRRYQVGEHFTPLPAPSTPFYFSNERFVSESGGQKEADANHWDFYPGMQPVEVFISGGALRAQADFPNVDVLGALERGVEGWNDVFGFPVFQATFVEDDEIRDDDASFVLVDYPGAGNGTSRGHTRVNPDNGEILAANVYLGSGPFAGLELLGIQPLSAPAAAPAQPVAQPVAQPGLALSWSGMSGSSSVFEEDPPPTATEPMPAASATREEMAAGWIQAYLTHEIGHTLGLRHNFKGSLVAPASSVMDYSSIRDTFFTDTPGTYDVAAIRYLYGLSPDLPTQAFCTDEDTLSDPNCGRFDSGQAPLYDYWAPLVSYGVDQVVDAQQPLTMLDGRELSQLLDFARDSDSTGFTAAVDRSNALSLALGRTQVPLDPELLADPQKVAAANAVAELVLRRSVLEPAGNNSAVPTDPDAIVFLSAQAGKMLRNEDGARSYALRRTAADVLWRLQSDAALLELRAAREALSEALQTSEETDETDETDEAASNAEPALEQDLLDRIDARLTPYYQ